MRIDGRTRLLGIVGRPIAHSLSPRIQNHALDRLGENAVYVPLEITEEDLADLLDLFPRIGGVGFNVTTPFKRTVGRLVRAGDEEVAMTGCVNTVLFREQGAVGFSTDGVGFRNWMQADGIQPPSGGIILLGFGATARSLTYRLGLEYPITIITRSRDVAITTTESWYQHGWQGLPIRIISWKEPPPTFPALLIAGLPVEFARSPQVAGWLAAAEPETIVVDLNYGIGRTPLRDQARDHGLTAHDGIGLLVHQAASSLSRWLDSPVDPDLLAESLREGP